MNARTRTRQLLYQAELVLAMPQRLAPPQADEHHDARRMACEESALAMLELALASLIAEITETCRWPEMPWREVLACPPRAVAEVERLRTLQQDAGSWLARLLANLDRLHSEDGAARRESRGSMIVSTQQAALGDELRWYLDEFKQLLTELRETGFEW